MSKTRIRLGFFMPGWNVNIFHTKFFYEIPNGYVCDTKTNTMKKLLSILILGITLGASAQKTLSKDYEYKVSAPYDEVDAEEKYYLSGDGKFISVKVDKRDIYVQRYNTDKPGLASEKKYEDAYPKNAVVERILFINGKAVLFYTQWDGKNKIEQLYVQEIDMDKGEFSGPAKLLLKIDGKVSGVGSGKVMDFNLVDKFIVYRSFDHKSFLVKYRRIPEKKDDKKSFDKIGLVAFDGNMNQLSSREITMPYTERRMNNLDYQLDNQGNLFMLTKVFHDDSNDDKKKKKDEEANYHIELFTLKSGSDKLITTKIDNKDKFISKLWIFDSPKGDLIAGGYFSNGKGKDFEVNCDGVITFKMKPDGTVYDQFTYDIPVELINEYESNKTKRKNEKKEEKGEGAKFTNLRLKDLEVGDDGSMVIVGEQQYIVVKNHAGMNGSSGGSTVIYYYNDILVTKILADGKLSWMKKIPKAQHGTKGQGGMSYQYFSNQNSHFLVFLDNVKNINLPVDKTPAEHTDGQGGYLTAVRLADADGSFTKGSILNSRDTGDFNLEKMKMEAVSKFNDNTFFVESYKKRGEDVLLKVILK